MNAEIIAVGTELLLGDIVNTDAQFLSRELAALGINVLRQHVVGDNHARLKELVMDAKQRCDLLVFSGGLGPTADDLTKETVAACFNDQLRFDPEEWAKITGFFTAMGKKTPPNNRKQAMVPVRGKKLPNANGTAPGAWFEDGGKIAVLLPGPPKELQPLWNAEVRPLLACCQNGVLRSLVLRVAGVGESDAEQRVGHLFQNQNPTAAIYAKMGEVIIRITARAQDPDQADQMCRAYAQKFYALLGDSIYAEGEQGVEYTLVHLLQQKGQTLAAAESLTGGMVAQRITDVPGASQVLGYSFVTYSNQAKQRLLGVDPSVLETYDAVSSQTAAQMAFGAKDAAGADLGLATTGLAGPGGGTPQRPVGLVYIAAAYGDTVTVKKLMIPDRSRDTVRTRTVQHVLEMARRVVLGQDVPGAKTFARGVLANLD